jgi:hypothetical protein
MLNILMLQAATEDSPQLIPKPTIEHSCEPIPFGSLPHHISEAVLNGLHG